MRTVTVRLFARLRELAGADQVSVEVPENATIGQLRQRLQMAYPQLPVSMCAVAVDAEFARDEDNLDPSGQIALLPPVSGG